MKISIARIIPSALVALAFGGFAAEPAAPAGRIDLFNGRDFSGWTFYMRSNAAPANTFTVTNGLIHCAGQPFGYMRTEKTFQNYRLTVEWRFVRIAPRADNTGIFVHVQPPDEVFPECVECQGQYQHQGDILLCRGAGGDDHPAQGGKTMVVRQNGASNENPVGEWNTNRVVCSGNTIELSVNGKTMNRITGCNLASGFIALQSEGGEWEAKRIYLEPLK